MNAKMDVKIRVSRWIYVYLGMVRIYHQVIVGGKPNVGVVRDMVIKAIHIEHALEK